MENINTIKQIKNGGYIVEQYNEHGYILTRENAFNSNYFNIIDGKPVFESMLYVNNTTKKLIERFIKKYNIA